MRRGIYDYYNNFSYWKTKPVQEYKGIVFGEVVEGRNFVKDFMSGIRDIVGGRSGSYEDSWWVPAKQLSMKCLNGLLNWVLMLLLAYPSNTAQ